MTAEVREHMLEQGLTKSTANLMTLLALSNLWMARKRLLNMAQG